MSTVEFDMQLISTEEIMQYSMIQDQISYHSYQRVNQTHISTLAASMKVNGWVGRPLLVVEIPDYENDLEDGNYFLLTPTHRSLEEEAARTADLEKIPCVVLQLDDFAELGISFQGIKRISYGKMLQCLQLIGNEDAMSIWMNS